MPELPEVECVVRALGSCLAKRVVADVEFLFQNMLQQGMDKEYFARQLRRRQVIDVKRRGKYILLFFQPELILEIHLRMTGRFFFAHQPFPPDKHTGAIFYFADGSVLHYQDIRKFGTFRLWEQDSFSQSTAYRLGPDPLSQDFSFSFFQELLERKKGVRLKPLLLNQQNLAGLGNIYADEILYRARIYPERTAGSLQPAEQKRLFKAVRAVLRESLEYGGTTFSDYRNVQGQSGRFQEHLKVYRREQQPCPRCGTAVCRTVVCGRGTYFCPSCQRK